MNRTELRRFITENFSLEQLAGVWADTFGRRMADEIPEKGLEFAAAEIILLADQRRCMETLEKNLKAPPGSLRLYWNIPHARNPYFVGRESLLRDLHTTLQTEKRAGITQAIIGLGGIGKTQTAVEYAYRHRDHYAALLWVGADSAENLRANLVGLATVLGLPERDAQDQNQIAAAVTRWLQNHDDWLLIFDNADDPEALKDALPTGVSGSILITSRARNLRALHITHPLTMPVLEVEEAVGFLFQSTGRDRSNPDEASAAASLASELGYLPLALEQATAYISVNEMSFGKYLVEYTTLRLELLDEQGPATGKYPETVRTTWTKNFAAVEQESPAAADLLRLCAFFAPDDIPMELFTDASEELGENLSAAFAEEAKRTLTLNRLLTLLEKYSLLTRNTAQKTVDIHRLVQEVFRDSMKKHETVQWANCAAQALGKQFPYIEFKIWPLCERLLPHARVAFHWISSLHLTASRIGYLLNQTGFYLHDRGLYSEAEHLAKLRLAINEQHLGAEHPGTATSLNNLAALYESQGRYADAELLHVRALRIKEQHLGANHPSTGTSLNNLAALYEIQGRYADAEPLYVRALRICEQHLGAEHPDTATSLNNLAALYQKQGRYADAEPLYVKALRIREQHLGVEHPDTATSLNNLALLYKNQSRYADAEPLYVRALRIKEQHLGANHPSTATSLNNLAGLYLSQGKISEVEPLISRVVAIMENALGLQHPNVALSIENYAYVLDNLGRHQEAQALKMKAASIRSAHSAQNQQ